MTVALCEVGVGRRLVAVLLDLGVAAILFVMLNVVLYKFGMLSAPKGSSLSPLLAVWSHAGPLVAFFGTLCALVVLSWSLIGGTPGALLIGINVVRERDGCTAGILRCTARLTAIFALAGLGVFSARRGRRAWYDRMTGMRAVREDELTNDLAHYLARS